MICFCKFFHYAIERDITYIGLDRAQAHPELFFGWADPEVRYNLFAFTNYVLIITSQSPNQHPVTLKGKLTLIKKSEY